MIARRHQVGVAVGGLLLALVSACGTTGPVGPTPGQTPSVETTRVSPTVESFQLDIFIDAESVTPVNRDFRLDVGQPVMLAAPAAACSPRSSSGTCRGLQRGAVPTSRRAIRRLKRLRKRFQTS